MSCRIAGLAVVALSVIAVPSTAQIDRVVHADEAPDRLGGAGESLWPAFRVDTIPIVWSFPGRGWALTSWSDDTLPSGFEATAVAGVASRAGSGHLLARMLFF